MWTVTYTREVRNYIFDSYPYTEAVWQAIKSLRNTNNGLPQDNVIEIESNLYQWETLGHTIIFRRGAEQRQIIIAALSPVE